MRNSSYTEWCNENESRSYPVSELASSVDDAGLKLPTDIVADLSVATPSTLLPHQVRISAVYLSSKFVSVVISDNLRGLLSVSLAIADMVPYAVYAMTPLSDNVSGYISFGSHRASTVESYRFSTFAQSGLETRAVRIMPAPGIASFQHAACGAANSATGLVALTATSDFVIRRDPSNSQNILIGLNPATSARFVDACSAAATGNSCVIPVIRSINGVYADANGKITLRFS